MAQTFTPGPWTAERRRFGSWTVLSPDGFYIVDRVLSVTDIEANARLIAAAPELLAALELALKYVSVVMIDKYAPMFLPDAERDHETIRNLIQKAEGR